MGERKPKEYQESLVEEKPVKSRQSKKDQEAPSREIKKDEPVSREKKSQKPTSAPVKKTVSRAKRSRRYLDKLKSIDKKRQYALPETIALIKKIASATFKEKIEAHIRLKPGKKGDTTELLRGKIIFPSGPIKTQKAVKFTPDLLPSIQKGNLDFDVLLASPGDLPTLAKVAKILGPKGKMPSAKAQTVVADPDKLLGEIEKGLTFWKADPQRIVHILVGKVDWPEQKIIDNIKALLATLPKSKILSFYLTSTTSPSVRIDPNLI